MRVIKFINLIRLKKAPLPIRIEQFKVQAISQLFYFAFLMREEFTSKNEIDKFSRLYYKTIRAAVGLGKSTSKEVIRF